MTFHAYLNIRDPFVAWEVAIGRFCSADNLQSDEVFSLSLRQFSLFRRYSQDRALTSQFKKELRLEKIRSERYPQLPSRLRGIFLFDNRADAEAAALRWDGSHFDPTYLTEVEMIPERQARLDSEWITSNLLSNREDSWIDSYWCGEVYGERPLREVICSGVGSILNMDLRNRAYQEIMRLFPRSVPLLSIACIAFNLGFRRAAQSVPYLLREGERVKCCHILNMNVFNDASTFYDALARYSAPWPPLAVPWDGVIQLPDLSDRWFYLTDSDLYQLGREGHPTNLSREPDFGRLRQAHDTEADEEH